jgi:MFS family permease
MRRHADLIRSERQARLFLLAHLQSSLGTGAAYVALLVLAWERLDSPWALSLVLFADFAPAMAAGPLFGAAADRWPRRNCALVAEIARALAFAGLGLVGGFESLFLFALLAGAGAGLFTPAVMAGLPGLLEDRDRLPAATSLYGAIADLGWTAGPVLGGIAVALVSPEAVMLVNAVSFALSAVVISRLDFGDVPDHREERRSLFAEAREGVRAASRLRGVPTVILASGAVVLFAGMLNVGQLVLAREVLGVGDVAFSLLVAVFGVGVIAGSLLGVRGGGPAKLKARYLAGIACVAACLLGAGLAPAFPVALAAFALGGVGNGLVMVHERLLLQEVVDDGLLGRVFGLKDTLCSWGFCAAFLGAGAVLATAGPRALFVIAGAGALLVWAGASVALRGTWRDTAEPAGEPVPRGLPEPA